MLLSSHRNAEGARATAASIRAAGGKASLFEADVSREADVERLVAETFAHAGGIDVWVNNAGADILTGAGAVSPTWPSSTWRSAVDLRGTVLCSWRVAERLRAQGGGVILNVSWDHVLARRARPARPRSTPRRRAACSPSASAWPGASRPRCGSTVLAPGWIATAFAEGLPEEDRRRIAANGPAQALGHPGGRGARPPSSWRRATPSS